MPQGSRGFSQLFRSHGATPSGARPRHHPELALALARARQEHSAARLLSSRGHLAEGLRLTLRAFDSAFIAAQLASARNEPAAAVRALRFRHEAEALDMLRRARSLDVPTLDHDVPLALRALMRDVGAVTHDMILSIEGHGQLDGSLAHRLRSWFAATRPRLPESARKRASSVPT
jgi:hypothetical protein